MRYIVPVFGLLAVSTLAGCPRPKDEGFTRGEAQEALEEAQGSSASEDLMVASVEISTSFTIGGAVENAAAELRAFLASELPCAEITLEGATLTVEYGAKPGDCNYRGHEFSGTTVVSVEANSTSDVRVHHEWIGFSNGVVTLDGTADVTWNFDELERHVVHHTEWTHLATGRTGVGEGDRVQKPLAGDIAVGFVVDGSRSWTGSLGRRWDLAIDGVEMRWADPVPQAGSYTLESPEGKTLSLSFSRVDSDTIEVTVTGPRGRSFSFNVNKL
ncbi:MAG TPA: hypothetical protein VFP10_13520 [Candidatus Eisenbacteria bacterium]|nr:hypothetical protein [Candidatus Eisenbacteria bacterium]